MKQKYNCKWCSHEFEKEVESIQGGFGGKISRHKGCFGTQVKCPKCRRFIPTWKTEQLNNSIGRKHIHLR